MKWMKHIKAAFAAASVAVMLTGMCLLLWPGLSAAMICTVLGAVAIVHGIIKLIGYFSNDLYRLAFQFDLAGGALTILIGGILLFHPENVLVFLPLVIGIFILVDSVLRVQTSIDAKHFGMKKWWVILAVSAAGAALGLLLLLRPFQSGLLMVRFMGLTLLLDGAENLLAGLYTVKVPRRSCAEGETIEAEFTVQDD